MEGVDVYDPVRNEIISTGANKVAAWFVDTDYNEESFFVRQAYFLGANDPYSALKTTLKSEIDARELVTLRAGCNMEGVIGTVFERAVPNVFSQATRSSDTLLAFFVSFVSFVDVC